MRIVVLGTRGFPDVQGGVEKHCEELYPRLAALGAEVTVITRKSYIKEKRDSFKGVKFVHLFSPKLKSIEAVSHTFLALFKLKKLKPDIVHVHAIGPSLLIPLIRLSGYKVVMTHHGPDYMRKKWGITAKSVLKTGEKNAVKHSDKIIAVGKWIQDYIEEKYKRKPCFIPNGVSAGTEDAAAAADSAAAGSAGAGSAAADAAAADSAAADSAAADSAGADSAGAGLKGGLPDGLILKKFGIEFNAEPEKYVFTAARFVPEKGLDDLINAYGLLDNPGFKLVIAGGADHETKYSGALKELADKTAGVILTGTVYKEDIYKLYSNAALFVLPSYYEGFPISLLEALSLGIPVLISDIPAHKEIPLPGFRYFRAGNIGELSEKLAECVQKGIGENEKKIYADLIKARYDWDVIAKKTLSVYKECLGG